MARKYVTEDQWLAVLNELSDLDETDDDQEESAFWEEFDAIPESGSTRIINNVKKTRMEVEQTAEDNQAFIEDPSEPNIATVIAGVSSDGNVTIADNINFEIIDQMQTEAMVFTNITNRSAIKWWRSDFARSEIQYLPQSNIPQYTDQSPAQYFKKYFTDHIFEIMTDYTNIYALQTTK